MAQFDISFKLTTGRIVPVGLVNGTTACSDLYRMAGIISGGFPGENFILKYEGRNFPNDERTLVDYTPRTSMLLHIIQKLRGGPVEGSSDKLNNINKKKALEQKYKNPVEQAKTLVLRQELITRGVAPPNLPYPNLFVGGRRNSKKNSRKNRNRTRKH